MPDEINAAVQPGLDDNRKYPRFPVAFPVLFGDSRSAQFGMVVDISREGCRIRCAAAGHRERYCQITIWPKDPSDTLVVDLAVMRWSRPGVFGVEFIRMTPDGQAKLAWIIRNCETPCMQPDSREDTQQPLLVRSLGKQLDAGS